MPNCEKHATGICMDCSRLICRTHSHARVWAYLDDIPIVEGEMEARKFIPNLRICHCDNHNPWTPENEPSFEEIEGANRGS